MATVSEILKRAKQCERKGDLDGAIAEFRQMVNTDPCPPIACNLMGDLYHKKGDGAQAFEWYQKAIENYAREDLYANAIGICRKVLRQDPYREEMLERLGGLFFSQGFLREAVKHYLDYAERMASRGDSETVLETATRVREILADDPSVRERLGDVLVRVSRPAEAVNEYRAALDGFRGCGRENESDRVAGKLDTAMADAGPLPEEPERAGAEKPAGDPSWDCESFGDLDEIGEEPEGDEASSLPAAEEDLPRSAEESGPGEKVHEIVLEEPDGAGAPTEEDLSPTGEEPDVSEEERVSPEEETPVLPREFDAPPEDFKNDSRLVSFHPPEEEAAGETPPLVDGLTGSLPEEDGSAEEIEILSPGGEDRQEVETEITSEEPAPVEDQPEDFVPVEQILKEFQNGVGKILDDDDHQSHYDMGMSYMEMGLFEEALAEFEQAAASPDLRLSCGEMMGAVLLEIHRTEEAIDALRPLVDGGENDSLGVHYLLGKAYERLGQKDRAQLEYRFVVERDADFRDARVRLERVLA